MMASVKERLRVRRASRPFHPNAYLHYFPMPPQQLAALYTDLQKVFNARPCDLKRCGSLLAQLKVRAYL